MDTNSLRKSVFKQTEIDAFEMQISGNSNTEKPFLTVPQTESAFQTIDRAATKVKYAFMIDILCKEMPNA